MHQFFYTYDIPTKFDCSTNVPPGSKLKLTGRIPICNGYLLLSRGCCTLLGGRVQNLVEGWMLKRASILQLTIMGVHRSNF